MQRQVHHWWSRFARLATACCLGLTFEAATADEEFELPRQLASPHASRPIRAARPSPIQQVGLSVPDDESSDWMNDESDEAPTEDPDILLTNFDETPPAPREFTVEDRLLELEQRLAEQQRENEVFRNRLGLSSSIEVDSPRTAAVPPPLEDLVFGAAAPDKLPAPITEKKEKEKAWYEKMKIRGYAQFRYNRIGETNPRLVNNQGDQSIGDNRQFLLRRARMIFSGDINDHVSYYIQPDFASGVTGPNPLHFLQLRDFYADIFLDADKEYRIRVGQSKIPYGWENLQSSQNRLSFDRSDPVNSGLVNERDLGVMFYWAPSEIRDRFKYLVDSGLKGSGDYGVFGFGVYNGQTANRPELNDGLHLVARATYPFQFANGQIFEPGLSGYTGSYNVARSAGIGGGDQFTDQRGALSFVLYPQPLGLQGEYTWGEGPELNATNTAVQSGSLEGGYFQIFYKWDEVGFRRQGTLIPYAKIQRYDGGRKHETNSPNYRIREAEVGVEYQLCKALELTVAYTWAERTFPVIPHEQEKGELVRMQLQWNY